MIELRPSLKIDKIQRDDSWKGLFELGACPILAALNFVLESIETDVANHETTIGELYGLPNRNSF